ncbi:hypothetical protein XA68_17474 [Ophiocordyceps unilateralis]|uniref:Spindle pole body component n=1 Tax=Ophiocordyceps unilateralis TaxID=268505 RepID=A0A2A9P3X4_OPHUN|nr:hypothetical protein XA68_17474 [Ophiocordyceps unilateralis]
MDPCSPGGVRRGDVIGKPSCCQRLFSGTKRPNARSLSPVGHGGSCSGHPSMPLIIPIANWNESASFQSDPNPAAGPAFCVPTSCESLCLWAGLIARDTATRTPAFRVAPPFEPRLEFITFVSTDASSAAAGSGLRNLCWQFYSPSNKLSSLSQRPSRFIHVPLRASRRHHPHHIRHRRRYPVEKRTQTSLLLGAMLHEMLLALSGHPSPLLRSSGPEADALVGITPPERHLLAPVAHLSHVHSTLITLTARIYSSHPSTICRAVAAATQSRYLSAFQRKVLDVEQAILSDDPAFVGAYSIVPLTAVVGEFQQWTARMDWLLETAQFILASHDGSAASQGVELIDRLRNQVYSGYRDVAETALSLLAAAETAWLKQVSAWILYGRLPSFGGADFFVQKLQASSEFVSERLPSFVTPATASSMLYIGTTLRRIQTVGDASVGLGGLDHVSSKLQQLARLKSPLTAVEFSRAVGSIRLSLSQKSLSKMLPLAKVVEMLQLLRDFFLLGRGEFALALVQEAEGEIRGRWRRTARERDDDVDKVAVNENEVASVLSRTWAVLAAMQGQHGDEDEQLDLARDLLQLLPTRCRPGAALGSRPGLGADAVEHLEALPFGDLLLSVPTMLCLQLPWPLDMVISPSDMQMYAHINSYLLSLRRAHIRLTDLWKMTSLRRHHTAPIGAGEQAAVLRKRWSARSATLRGSWTTASAAVFFLGETEAYLQAEVVGGMWESLSSWLEGRDDDDDDYDYDEARCKQTAQGKGSSALYAEQIGEDADLFLPDEEPAAGSEAESAPRTHDPQTLGRAHSVYLSALAQRLLLAEPTFTEPLYKLLKHMDRLASLMRRLHAVFIAADLEADAGVVDASVDLGREEAELTAQLGAMETQVRKGIEDVVGQLRILESRTECEAEAVEDDVDDVLPGRKYVVGRIGGVDRLLMKLDFGSWLGSRLDGWEV